jgi:hypothetical protein
MEKISNLAKYKYLDFIPRPRFLDTRTYDLVDEKTFLEDDGRIPLVLITRFGIFPKVGTYGDKPGQDITDLEVFKNKTIGLVGMVYLSGKEYKGIIPCYVDEKLIDNLKYMPDHLNTGLWKNNNLQNKMN